MSPESSHLIAADALRDAVCGAGFEIRAWNDLTGSAIGPMRRLLGAPPAPLGLHVFVEDFATKAGNLLSGLEAGPAADDPGRARGGVEIRDELG